jgi:hypothetical protein
MDFKAGDLLISTKSGKKYELVEVGERKAVIKFRGGSIGFGIYPHELGTLFVHDEAEQVQHAAR